MMDEGWKWWTTFALPGEATVEIPDDVLQRVREVSAEYSKLQEYLEHAYRHQEGLQPYLLSPFKGAPE
jgi:hypothetical protein